MLDLLARVTLAEVFFGGGGRLTALGPVSLRMILFVLIVAAGFAVAALNPRRRDGQLLAVLLLLGYLVTHLPAAVIGLARGAAPADVVLELQQSLYWLSAPFFALAIKDLRSVKVTASIVEYAGITMAVLYLGTLLLILAGQLDFANVYVALGQTEEFFFRGESFFFYKGFLFLGVATIFLVARQRPHWAALAMLVVAATIMTLTRGFILATGFAILLLLLDRGKLGALVLSGASLALAVFLVFIYLPGTDATVLVQREESTSQRVDDFRYLVDHFRAKSLLVGEGFGSEINGRLQVENTFLWAFWKMGILGLMFWLSPLAIAWHYYRSSRKDDSALARAYFYGVVLIYVQTAANPYLNNPIGLSFVIVAIFCLRKLSQPHEVPRAERSRPLPMPANGAAA